VLPELRPVILQGALPTDVYQMLMNGPAAVSIRQAHGTSTSGY